MYIYIKIKSLAISKYLFYKKRGAKKVDMKRKDFIKK